jgi:hypothetical protein
VTRLIIVVLLAAVLVGLAAVEQHFIQGAYGRLEREANELYTMIHASPDPEAKIDTPENKAKIDGMYEWWLKTERRLTMLARHFDLAQISTNLIYAKNFIHFDNKEEANVGLLQVIYLVKTHSFNVGTSIQNVI